MNQIALLTENTALYWYSFVLALSVLTGGCIFMGCCSRARISMLTAAAAVLLSLVLSLVFSRAIFWYCRTMSFRSFRQAMTQMTSGGLALAGAFLGCGVTALLLCRFAGGLPKLLDCMSVAGCGAIALGRLSNFFSAADRGQIATEMVNLPWAYPVLNVATGLPEYRLATFLLQSFAAGALFVLLAWLFFFRPKKRELPDGDITAIFLMVYGASQVILDSTRYDSLYLRSNGFVSMVQILAAVALAAALVYFSVRAVKLLKLQDWMVAVWAALVGLFGLAGFMEYYVQRHGRRAFFAYSVMEHCLVGILVLGFLLWNRSRKLREPEISNPETTE